MGQGLSQQPSREKTSALVASQMPYLVARSVDLAARVTDISRVGLLPHVVDGGRWQWAPAGAGGRWTERGWRHGSWTGGFAAGVFLAAGLVTGDEDDRARLAAAADVVISRLEGRVHDRSTHDLGFLFWPSACLSARLTGDPRHQAIGREAARTLMGRAHSSGMLTSWGEPADPRASGLTAIDTMMNLPLLWWAAAGGVPEAERVARAHADATARHYIRDDGTVWHYLRLDDDGRVRERGSKQGLDADSAWSRGLSWAVHGFVTAQLRTGEERYLHAARRCCEAFLRLLGHRAVPPYDFRAPADGGAMPSDASAAAVVASALQQAGRQGVAILGDGQEETIDRLVGGLLAGALSGEGNDGLLTLTSYSVPEGLAVDGGATWADFFLLRAIAPYWSDETGVDVGPLFDV